MSFLTHRLFLAFFLGFCWLAFAPPSAAFLHSRELSTAREVRPAGGLAQMQIDKEGKLVLSFEMDRPANSAASSRPSRDQDDAWHIAGAQFV